VSSTKDEVRKKRKSAFSRRGFLQGLGAGTGVLSTGILAPEQAEEFWCSASFCVKARKPLTLVLPSHKDCGIAPGFSISADSAAFL